MHRFIPNWLAYPLVTALFIFGAATVFGSTPCIDAQYPPDLSACSPDTLADVFSPVTFSASWATGADVHAFSGCSNPYTGTETVKLGDGAEVPITALSATYSASFPLGYNYQEYELRVLPEDCASSVVYEFNVLESPPVSGSIIAVSSTLATSIASNVGAQLADGGTLSLVLMVAGVYLVFWVMRRIIKLIPSDKTNAGG